MRLNRVLGAVLIAAVIGWSGAARAEDEIGWFGFGLRVASSPSAQMRMDNLAAMKEKLDDLGYDTAGGARDMRLPERLSLVPTLHLGGDGYFFRFEFPVSYTKDVQTAGIGIYPFCYGFYFSKPHLMPYLMVGWDLTAMYVRETFPTYTEAGVADGKTERIWQVGALLEPRLVVGFKFFGFANFPISFEVAWSPLAATLVGEPERVADSYSNDDEVDKTFDPASELRGGAGQTLMFSIGVEWF